MVRLRLTENFRQRIQQTENFRSRTKLGQIHQIQGSGLLKKYSLHIFCHWINQITNERREHVYVNNKFIAALQDFRQEINNEGHGVLVLV